MNVGIVFGGYCPMHQGHLDLIMKAKKECSRVYVVVCGYNGEPRSEELGLPLDKRFQIIKDYFQNDEIIKVIKINDSDLGIDESESMDNWVIWTNAVFKQILEDFHPENQFYVDKCRMKSVYGMNGLNSTFKFYVGVQEYYDAINKLKAQDYTNNVQYDPNHENNIDRVMEYGNCIKYNIDVELVGIDKNGSRIHDISATKIRQNPLKHWNKIIKPFRQCLTKKILITGTASEGKTTLVSDIAKYFDCPYTTEYGRDYMALRNITDTDLTFNDFLNFVIGQNDYYKHALDALNNNGVIISDTDNLVTLMYAKAYSINPEMIFNEDDYKLLHQCVKTLNADITWDKIFVFPPNNAFVDDGTRYMGQSSIEERTKNYNYLIELLKEFNLSDKVEVLDGTFYENFIKVKNYINDLYI